MNPDTGHTAVRVSIGVALVAIAATGNAGVAGRLGGHLPPASAPAAPRQATVAAPLSVGSRAPDELAPPTRIRIPRISVAAPVAALQPGGDLNLPAPPDPGVAGWYARSPVPGQMGPAVIVGHLDSYRGPAVFWRLGELRPGDEVVVGRSDGSSSRFLVARAARYARAGFPSADVYGPTPTAELRLITCGGLFNFLTGQYLDNVVVYATGA
jgi:hypothetical protein